MTKIDIIIIIAFGTHLTLFLLAWHVFSRLRKFDHLYAHLSSIKKIDHIYSHLGLDTTIKNQWPPTPPEPNPNDEMVVTNPGPQNITWKELRKFQKDAGPLCDVRDVLPKVSKIPPMPPVNPPRKEKQND